MALAMRRPGSFSFALLTRDDFVSPAVMEPDFDDDAYAQPVTAELLDWYDCREWPALQPN